MRLRLGLTAALVGIAAAALTGPPIRQYLMTFLEWVQRFGPAGAVVFGLAFVVAAPLFVPSAIFSLGAGFLFGLPLGALVMSISSTAGAAVAFLLARSLGRDWVRARLLRRPRAAALGRAVETNGFKIVLLTRLSPLLPYNVLNYAYGVTGVRFRTFVLASWMGMLPGTLMYVYLGTAFKTIAALLADDIEPSPGRQILFAMGLAATIGATWVATRTAARELDEVI